MSSNTATTLSCKETSAAIRLEVLVQPMRQNAEEVAARWREILLNAEGLVTIERILQNVERAADLHA